MPSLPKPVRRPWQPAPVKREYAPHAARDGRYDTAQWQTARKAQIARCPCCVVCASQGRTTPATVTDHIQPVRLGGDFWNSANHQSLCNQCHQRKSQSEKKL